MPGLCTPCRPAAGDVKGDVRAKGAQDLHQQSCGRLAVGVQVAPHGDSLALLDRPAQALDSQLHVRQVKWQGGT